MSIDASLCADCGMDCTPCTHKRGCRHDGRWEFYQVHDAVWSAAGMPPLGFLCVECIEKRLGRRLEERDFTKALINLSHPYDTPRMASRKIGWMDLNKPTSATKKVVEQLVW